MEKNITITMEEYKELLIIKGRYEELKEQSGYKLLQFEKPPTLIENPYKITC